MDTPKPSDVLAAELARHHVAAARIDAPAEPPDQTYERLPTNADLTHGSAQIALEALGATVAVETSPVLHVPAVGWRDHNGGRGDWFPFMDAIGIALRNGMRLMIDPSLDDMDEWYIEYGGRRVGSPGC